MSCCPPTSIRSSANWSPPSKPPTAPAIIERRLSRAEVVIAAVGLVALIAGGLTAAVTTGVAAWAGIFAWDSGTRHPPPGGREPHGERHDRPVISLVMLCGYQARASNPPQPGSHRVIVLWAAGHGHAASPGQPPCPVAGGNPARRTPLGTWARVELLLLGLLRGAGSRGVVPVVRVCRLQLAETRRSGNEPAFAIESSATFCVGSLQPGTRRLVHGDRPRPYVAWRVPATGPGWSDLRSWPPGAWPSWRRPDGLDPVPPRWSVAPRTSRAGRPCPPP